jgi:hypothetical protein
MKRYFLMSLAPLTLYLAAHNASSQVLTYADCVVDDVPSLEAAISSFYDSLDASVRPIVYLDQWLWNGEFSPTHRVIVGHQNYAALEAFRASIGRNPAPSMRAGRSFDLATDCQTDGLSILRGAWGSQDVEPIYWQVYGVATSDGAAYAEALGGLVEARGDDFPLVTVLFENRAGISGDTHLVGVGAATFAGLNESLDELFASDEFADFVDEVGADRRLTWRAQAFRMRTWAPGGN